MLQISLHCKVPLTPESEDWFMADFAEHVSSLGEVTFPEIKRMPYHMEFTALIDARNGSIPDLVEMSKPFLRKRDYVRILYILEHSTQIVQYSVKSCC